jgi:hypothetical protein
MAYLSDTDKAFFKENGYLVKHDLMTETQHRDAMDVVWENLDCDRHDPKSWINAGPNHPPVGAHPAIRLTLYETPLFAMAEELVGKGTLNDATNPGPHFRYPTGETDWEMPGSGHLDGYYTPTNGVPEGTVGRFQVGASFYLNNVVHRGGAFTIWPGTHIQAAEYFRTHSLLTFKGGNANDTFDMPAAVEITGGPGTVCFWHGQLMHTGAKNCSNEIRMALITRFSRKDINDMLFEFPDDIWTFYEGIQ